MKKNKNKKNPEEEGTIYTSHGMVIEKPKLNSTPNSSSSSNSTYATRYMSEPIPKNALPEKGVPSNVAYQLIKDLRSLDIRPNLNLASFVTTWMEPEVRELMMDSLDVNFVNVDEYPSCTTISNRCVSMLSKLFHAPGEEPIGAPCVGSSEAIMLCGLAMKKRWASRQKAGYTGKPNLVMGSETHVCWEKFCRYWDVEARYISCEEGRYIATPELLESKCDENTIGVVAVFGSTYTGEFEDVKAIDEMVGKLNKKNGWELVVHVDGASGAFVAPFQYPDIEFDFRLPHVASINVSGHKYGLVYPGIGWALWRSADYLPESMIFYSDYLGTVEKTITLNFSRGANQIIGQYYQFLRLGIDGYTKIINNLMAVASFVRRSIEKMDHFEIISKEQSIPLVAFRLKKKKQKQKYDEYQVADRLRMYGWVIPAYSGPKGAEKVKMMRITIREDFSMAMAEQVMEALKQAVAWLDSERILMVP